MPFIWVAITLPILLLMHRWIHTHLHGLSLLLTGSSSRAVIIYAIILLPGVLLHEFSHWITANLLGVRTGSFSVIPRQQADGSVQLGYVEYYKGRNLGPIRESLIGGAPLIFGTAVILLIGFRVFGVEGLATAVQTGDIDAISQAMSQLMGTEDILLWIYLLFAIGNAMLPSASDRRAWPAFIIIFLVVALITTLLGLQNVVFTELASPAALVFGYLGIAFSIAIATNILFMLIITGLESLISRLKGVSVVYGS